jgi:hypothetical protein
MPDLGNRANVMGPQPIAQRLPVPPDMLEAAHRIMKLLAQGDAAGLEAIAVEKARGDAAALARSARPGAYDKDEIIGHARMSRQYYLKARLSGPGVEPLTFQVRLGEQEGRWLVFEVKNLSGRRSAWTK